MLDIQVMLRELTDIGSQVEKFLGRSLNREELLRVVELEMSKRCIEKVGEWVSSLRDDDLHTLELHLRNGPMEGQSYGNKRS